MVRTSTEPAASNTPSECVQSHEQVLQPVPERGEASSDRTEDARPQYLTGWKLWTLLAGLWIALFLSTLETTIVSTSLVSITNFLDGFMIRDWIVTAYLITYTGFLTIYAKLSDILGRKTMLITGIILFTVFSAVCGASNNIHSLIISRAFQGMGASGIYAMIMVIAPGLVPPEKFGKLMSLVSTVFILASLLGPILGGVINDKKDQSWRWVFLLNIPGGVLSLIAVIICLPSTTHLSTSHHLMATHLRSKFSRKSLMRIDYVGMALLLTFSVLLVFSLEEGGTRYSWNSGIVIGTLVIAVITGIGFASWEVFIDKKKHVCEPVFPPGLVKERLTAAILLTAFFTGFPFTAIVVNIPQRAQAVSGLSPLGAGITLLPLLLASPVATAFSGFLTGSMKIPPFYLIITGTLIQLVGIGLTCSLPTNSTDISRSQYGFQVLIGAGFGLGLTSLLIFARAVVSEDHIGVMMGGMTQIRTLGGTISLAIW
ncbi:hypothetical protein JX266_004635 [Neoarthrinium moseri]|nr:hypothetical protein JX266_004635 [Neoarthrinium moseri]